MQPWSLFTANPCGGARRRDGVALSPYNLHAERLANADEYHPEWGNLAALVMDGDRPAYRHIEGWLVSFPAWGSRDLGKPRLVLGSRTETATREYIDGRFPLPSWWLDLDHDFLGQPPVRVI